MDVHVGQAYYPLFIALFGHTISAVAMKILSEWFYLTKALLAIHHEILIKLKWMQPTKAIKYSDLLHKY